ncbi:hypothetical protein HY633_05540 [Candidatus Uhrbacteria bacterium]|nr:hypothetical protein [Candidatus Uhrbacteria bacterium]
MEFLAGYSALLDYRYWFNPNPVPLGPTLVGSIFTFFAWFLIAWAVLVLLARGIRKHEPHKAKILRRFGSVFGSTGLLGLLLLFFAYEQLPLLRMRLWLLPLLAYFSFRLCRLGVHAVREYPRERAAIAERQRFLKYLPQRKA